MKHKIFIFLFFTCARFLQGQLPDTDIWLIKLEKDTKAERPFPARAQNITNRPGYDNQPAFSPDGKRVYYVSIREDKQADIYFFDVASGKITQLTHSPESEYSPVPAPDGKILNTVMVEADSAQRIHFADAEKGMDLKRLEPDSVGYYTFLNADTVIYYKLTQPHSLRYYSAATGEDKWLGNAPTRTFRAINRHCIVFGLKDSASVGFYKYDFLIRKAVKICDYPSLNEDVVWHPGLGLVKSEGTTLYYYNEGENKWQLLYELGLFGIKKITRFAFDAKGKYLVVVNNL